jgi:hypothetical protein
LDGIIGASDGASFAAMLRQRKSAEFFGEAGLVKAAGSYVTTTAIATCCDGK